MIGNRSILAAALLIAVLTAGLALTASGEAWEITGKCRFTATVHPEKAREVTTDNYSRYWTGTGGALTVTLPAGASAQGLELSFYMEASPVTVEALDESGAVTGQAVYRERYLNTWLGLPSAAAYRISALNHGDPLVLSRVRVYAGDTLPEEAQLWHEPETPVDMLQIVAHPDDELLWFGGLLPTYAGERRMNVLVAYAAVRGSMKGGRFNELLDGLWTCGVTAYPEFGPFGDFQAKSMTAVLKRWGDGEAQAWCTRLIRQYRPRVVVTQDIRGESGHMQHQVLSRAVIDAVTSWSGDPDRDPESAGRFGVFTPQKLYIHRYRENELFMDWDRPLPRFGGKSGTQVAREAFRKHLSQRNTHYHIYTSGPLDSRYLGLYFSTVGPDEEKNDLFEHVRMDEADEI